MNAIQLFFIKFNIIVLIADIIKIQFNTNYVVIETTKSNVIYEVSIEPKVFSNEQFEGVHGNIATYGDGRLILSGVITNILMISVKTDKGRQLPRFKDDDLFGMKPNTKVVQDKGVEYST